MTFVPASDGVDPAEWRVIRGSCRGALIKQLDLVGAVVAVFIYISSIITFAARLIFDLRPGHWIGIPYLLMTFPLGYLLYRAPSVERPLLYYLQVGLMLASIVGLFLLDYVFKVDWRNTRSVVVSFVTLYFAGMGGMIGVASRAGQVWTIAAVVLFLAAGVTAFVQRAVTGL